MWQWVEGATDRLVQGVPDRPLGRIRGRWVLRAGPTRGLLLALDTYEC
jgi:hypothetical protein